MSVPYFQCDNCEIAYQFEPSLVGQAVRCRNCGFVFRVPQEAQVDLRPAETAKPLGTGRWYLRFPNGRQFGPVSETMLQEWVAEERATAKSWILEEGTDEWQKMEDTFPQWFAVTEAEDPYAPQPLAIEGFQAMGFLDHMPDEISRFGPEEKKAHLAMREQVAKECQRAGGYVRLRGSKSFLIGEKLVFGETHRLAEEAKPESVLVCSLQSQTAEFYLVIPWSRLGQLTHEFFSVLPGRLPSSIALRRKSEDGFEGGVWVGASGTEDDVLAVAAKRSQEDLVKGIQWIWLNEERTYTMVLVWGLQAVPLGAEKFIHLVQTARMGPGQADFGILWYLERQSAFYRFARRLSLPQDHETHFLYASCAGQLLTRSVESQPE